MAATALQSFVEPGAHTGLLTYSGPHWSTFGMRDHFQYTLDSFRRTVFAPEAGGHDGPLQLVPAQEWTDDEAQPHHVDRVLHSLLQHLVHAGTEVLAVVIGRFQRDSHMTRDLLQAIVDIPVLAGLPIVGNVDIGHTSPMLTLPIGGDVEVTVTGDDVRLRLLTH